MLKKGMALLGVVGLAIVANLFFTVGQLQAINPAPNGCFVFKDQPPICPDKYCQPGTASCSNDGKRCYCKPRFLASSTKNQACEVIFGSKAIFKTSGGKNTIYFHGGIWSQMANSIPGSSSVETIEGEPAIKFDHYGGEIYKSGFLNDLAKKVPINKGQYDFQRNVNMIISARIDAVSGIGEIYNQRYEIPSYDGQAKTCAHLQYGNQPFFLKYSSFNDDPFDPKRSPCIMPSAIMTLFVFGKNSATFLDTEALVPMTKNCTDQKWEHGAGGAEKFIKQIFSKDNIDLHLLMANLTVPHGQIRKLYLAKEDKFFFGEIIDGTNTAEKLQRIAERCKNECRSSRPPRDCRFCNTPITQAIRANPTKTLNDIIIDGLINKDKAICSLVDTSMDYISGVSSNTPRQSFLDKIRDVFKKKSNSTEEEQILDRQIPPGIKRLCSSDSLSDEQRIRCKRNALECYLNNLPEEEPTDMCNQLTGELETSRWLICPASNTLSAAADRSVNHIQEFFQLNSSSIFNNPVFKQAWSIFRNASNIFLVIIMLWLIISQITNYGLSNYSIKKMIPRLVVGVVLVNLSFLLAQIAVDLSNLAGSGFFYLFNGLSEQLKLSGAASISASSIALGVLTGAGSLVILGGLTVLLPSLVVVLIGLVFIILLLSMRHGLVVIFVLLMPFAIIANIIPRLDNVFRTWFKNFFNIIMLYPVIGFLYGGGRFLKFLLIGVAEGDNMIQLIGFAMPVLATLATPLVLISITKGMLSLNNFMNNQYNRAKTAGANTARNSDFNQTIKTHQSDLKLRIANSKFARGVYGNKLFNKAFTGAGYDIVKRNQARKSQNFSTFQNVVNNDNDLLTAFHADQGRLDGDNYQKLSQSQQQKYRQLVDLNAMNDEEFYTMSLNTIAANGGTSPDGSQIIMIINNAQHHNVGQEAIQSKLFVAGKIAEKAGHPVTSSLLAQASDKVANNKAKKLDSYMDTAFGKIRPGNLKVDDFKTQPNKNQTGQSAIEALRAKIKVNDRDPAFKSGLSNHYLSAIGQDYHMIPEAIKQMIDQDIIDSITDYQVKTGRPTQTYTSATEALRAENLLKTNFRGQS